MKKHFPMLLTIALSLVISSVAFADTTKAQKSIPPVDVTSAAAAVPLALNTINLSDEEILGVASPVQVSMHGLALHGLAITAANEVEGPETEGPDSDGPGGPDHQFEGEEDGQH